MGDQPARTPTPAPAQEERTEWRSALLRFARYVAMRGIAVLITVGIGVYIAVWVSQIGGYADGFRRTEIRVAVAMSMRGNSEYQAMSQAEKEEYTAAVTQAAIAASGLNKPFFLRSFKHTAEALSLTLGRTRWAWGGMTASRETKEILLEALPMTLVLFGTANLITFFGSLLFALVLSRRYGGFLDRASAVLVPVFAAPPWFHGIFLIVIFAAVLRVLPYGGIVDIPPPATSAGYTLSFLKHMILPVTAWLLGTIPAAAYTGRAFFLIHSSEDFVELAKAKGLRASRVQRRYILRPVLPTIVTNFAFTLIVAWQGAVLTELIFNWPGLGRILFEAIGRFEAAIVIGAVVIFAYLLALTVLLLDIIYALVDPRVKLGGGERP